MVIERQTNSFHFFAKVARFDTKKCLTILIGLSNRNTHHRTPQSFKLRSIFWGWAY